MIPRAWISSSLYTRRHSTHEIDVQFFFFQAEDGIRDLTVTGVQTCALPIFLAILGVGTFAAYSIIAYKTPWCVISIIWPLFFVFGAFIVIVPRTRFIPSSIKIGRASCRERV